MSISCSSEEDDPKLKTMKLPHGSLKMRAQQPDFIYNEDELLEMGESVHARSGRREGNSLKESCEEAYQGNRGNGSGCDNHRAAGKIYRGVV